MLVTRKLILGRDVEGEFIVELLLLLLLILLLLAFVSTTGFVKARIFYIAEM